MNRREFLRAGVAAVVGAAAVAVTPPRIHD